MSILKNILKIMALIICLLVLLTIGVLIYASIDKNDSFFVRNATLEDFEYLKKVYEATSLENQRYGVQAHRISSGDGVILGYRWYSNGKLSAIDDEVYTKLTIFAPSDMMEADKVYDLSRTPSLVVLYSHGGSAWPMSGCHGFVVEGSLIFKHIHSHRIDAELYAKKLLSPLKIPEWCKAEKIPSHFEFKELEESKLTPWLGKPAKHIYHETYRVTTQ